MKIIAIATVLATILVVGVTFWSSSAAMERCLENHSRDVCVTSLN